MKVNINFFKVARILFVLISYLMVAVSATGQTISSGETLKSKYSQTAPVLDSQFNEEEWKDAQTVTQNLDLFDLYGKKVESHLLSLYIKNDDTNLYIAGILAGEEHDGTMQNFDVNTLLMDYFMIAFDNNDNGVFQAGEDKKSLYILNQTPSLNDEHVLTSTEQQQGEEENSEPQNTLGGLTYSQSSNAYVFEVAIPLASGDTSDFQIQPGQKIRWNLLYMDKFNFKFEGTNFGGLTGNEWTNSTNWSYIELASPRSMKDIHVFAALMNNSDLTQQRLQFIGSHYDLVLTAYPLKRYVDPLKDQNSDLQVLLFNNPYFSFGEQFWNATSKAQLNQVVQQYSLKTPNNLTINYGGPVYEGFDQDQNEPLMDIRNPAWQDYFTAQSRKHVEAANLDGVFLDTFTQEFPQFALAQGNQFPKNYSEAGWKASTNQFLAKIKSAFEGTQSTIIFNGITRGPGYPSEPNGLSNQEVLDQLDGSAIETYGINKTMDESNQTKSWYFYETIMGDFKEASDQGKWMVIEAYGNRDDVQTRLYALCSFLLVQKSNTFFYFTRKDQAGALHWRPEWDVKLGKPLGPFQKLANGSYSRDFEKGKVLVNPLSTNAVVTGLSGYQNWVNGQQVNNLTLPPYSGALLTSN